MCNKILFLFFIPLILISCRKDTTGIETEDPLPPGYQQDIPWPSLADSPWPMGNHDPQNTGRSNYPGPIHGEIEWEYTDNLFYIQCGVTVGEDSSLYFHTPQNLAGTFGFISLSPQGTPNWNYDVLDYCLTTPIVTSGNIIYLGNLIGEIYAINGDGTLKWKNQIPTGIPSSVFNISKDGNYLYVVGVDCTLYQLDNTGNVVWQNADVGFRKGANGMSISPDGNTLYLAGIDVSVIAFDINSQSIKWTFGSSKLDNAPLIDSNGNLYFSPHIESGADTVLTFYCLKPDGNVRYKFNYISLRHLHQGLYFASPTMDKMGNIYFATDTLYSLDYFGQLRWKLPLGDNNRTDLTCDVNGVVYLSIYKNSINIIAVSSTGNILWSLPTNLHRIARSPAIGFNNRLYFIAWRQGGIISIK